MKHVRESLKQFETYQFFKLFEEKEKEEPGTDKDVLKNKEKDGLAIVNKVAKNFDQFKKEAKGEILKYKEFWEENKSTKKAFSEKGSIYKLFDDDYVVGVLELPVETLPDGSVEGGLGAKPEPEEEIIEGAPMGAPVTEAFKETKDDLDLGTGIDPAENIDGTELADETPSKEQPASEEPAADVEPEPEPQTQSEEPTQTQDLKAPQTYLVVYDLSGGEREEIFRCGSNNVVKAFNAFYNDTFKGAMKDIIAQYKQEKEVEKTEAEKKEKEKKQTEKSDKVKKFLGEGMLVPNKPDNLSWDNWINEVQTCLVEDHDIDELDVNTFVDIANDQLHYFFNEGVSPCDAAVEVAVSEEIQDKFQSVKPQTSPDVETPEVADANKKYDYFKYNKDVDDFEKEQSLWQYLKSRKIKDFADSDEEKPLLKYFKKQNPKQFNANENMSLSEAVIDGSVDDDFEEWMEEVKNHLIDDFGMDEVDYENCTAECEDQLNDLYEEGVDPYEAAEQIVNQSETDDDFLYPDEEEFDDQQFGEEPDFDEDLESEDIYDDEIENDNVEPEVDDIADEEIPDDEDLTPRLVGMNKPRRFKE